MNTGKSHHAATLTPGLWCTGPTHVAPCSYERKKEKRKDLSMSSVWYESSTGTLGLVLAHLLNQFCNSICVHRTQCKHDEPLQGFWILVGLFIFFRCLDWIEKYRDQLHVPCCHGVQKVKPFYISHRVRPFSGLHSNWGHLPWLLSNGSCPLQRQT